MTGRFAFRFWGCRYISGCKGISGHTWKYVREGYMGIYKDMWGSIGIMARKMEPTV